MHRAIAYTKRHRIAPSAFMSPWTGLVESDGAPRAPALRPLRISSLWVLRGEGGGSPPPAPAHLGPLAPRVRSPCENAHRLASPPHDAPPGRSRSRQDKDSSALREAPHNTSDPRARLVLSRSPQQESRGPSSPRRTSRLRKRSRYGPALQEPLPERDWPLRSPRERRDSAAQAGPRLGVEVAEGGRPALGDRRQLGGQTARTRAPRF